MNFDSDLGKKLFPEGQIWVLLVRKEREYDEVGLEMEESAQSDEVTQDWLDLEGSYSFLCLLWQFVTQKTTTVRMSCLVLPSGPEHAWTWSPLYEHLDTTVPKSDVSIEI